MNSRKTVVLEKMQLSSDNAKGQMRMTDKVLETKSFDERNADQVLADPALSKQWRLKALQPQQRRTEPIKTIEREFVKTPDKTDDVSDKNTRTILEEIRSTEDIGYLQNCSIDSRTSVANAAKARIKALS